MKNRNRNQHQKRLHLEWMEPRLMLAASPIDLDQAFTEPPEGQAVEIESEASAAQKEKNSDPLGLTSSNQPIEEAPRVFIVDARNPRGIRDPTGINRIDVTADTPLRNLDAFIDRGFLRDGDQIYIRDGDYELSAPIRIDQHNVVFAGYPDETPIVRYGSFVYHWAMDVRGNGFTMERIDMVGNVETDAGRLYSHLMLVIRGDNATIQNSIFRHNSNYLPVEEGGDIAFGNRVDANGNPRTDAQQLWGRLVGFVGSQGSEFSDNVVVVLEAQAIENWERDRTAVEGVRLESSEVLIERNQFGATGHQMIASAKFSTATIRYNSFGDTSDYERLLPFTLSKYVRVPATHTAVGLGINDGSEFSHNLLVYNKAHPEDTGNGLQIQGTTNSEIFNNLFVDAEGIGHGIHLGFNRFSTVEIESAYNRIYNNTFVNVPTPMYVGYFHGGAPPGGNAIHDNEVFNNLAVMSDANKNSPFAISNVPLTTNIGDPDLGNGNTLYNNLLLDEDSDIVFKANTETGIVSLTIDELNELPYATDNLSADPMFVNRDQGDFRVQQTSPAIVANSNVYQPPTDFEGRPRSSEFVVIGAFGVEEAAPQPTFQIDAPDSFRGKKATLTITSDQPNSTTIYSFDIDWDGDGTVDETVQGPTGTMLSHRYDAEGTYTVFVDVTDADGQTLASLSHTFTLTSGKPG